MDNPDFWEWVKNKIREREQQQQPVQMEIQLPIPASPPPANPYHSNNGLYEEVDHEIKSDVLHM